MTLDADPATFSRQCQPLAPGTGALGSPKPVPLRTVPMGHPFDHDVGGSREPSGITRVLEMGDEGEAIDAPGKLPGGPPQAPFDA